MRVVPLELRLGEEIERERERERENSFGFLFWEKKDETREKE